MLKKAMLFLAISWLVPADNLQLSIIPVPPQYEPLDLTASKSGQTLAVICKDKIGELALLVKRADDQTFQLVIKQNQLDQFTFGNFKCTDKACYFLAIGFGHSAWKADLATLRLAKVLTTDEQTNVGEVMFIYSFFPALNGQQEFARIITWDGEGPFIDSFFEIAPDGQTLFPTGAEERFNLITTPSAIPTAQGTLLYLVKEPTLRLMETDPRAKTTEIILAVGGSVSSCCGFDASSEGMVISFRAGNSLLVNFRYQDGRQVRVLASGDDILGSGPFTAGNWFSTLGRYLTLPGIIGQNQAIAAWDPRTQKFAPLLTSEDKFDGHSILIRPQTGVYQTEEGEVVFIGEYGQGWQVLKGSPAAAGASKPALPPRARR